jgi:curved DNA-binding protein CbpA
VNPYEVLGVRTDAPTDEIHRAYLQAARRYHPDFHTDASPRQRADAEEHMRLVNEAWAILGDPARRQALADAEPPRPFQPFHVDEDEPDPRDAPDVPYRPTGPATGRQRVTTMAPVLLLAAALVVGIIGLFMRLTGIVAFAFILFLLACVGFLVVPLLALSRARQDEG